MTIQVLNGRGMNQDVTTQPAKTTEIPQQITWLRNEIAQLQDNLKKAFDRLAPVLSPDAPEPTNPNDDEVKRGAFTPLGSELQNMVLTLSKLNYSIIRIIQRIET